MNLQLTAAYKEVAERHQSAVTKVKEVNDLLRQTNEVVKEQSSMITRLEESLSRGDAPLAGCDKSISVLNDRLKKLETDTENLTSPLMVAEETKAERESALLELQIKLEEMQV